jgi:hypothetical protein
MYLNKKSVIAGLQDLGDFKVITDVEDSIASDLILVERKGSRFLLSFNDEYDDSDLGSNKSLESPFGVHLIRSLDGVYKGIPLLDKYRISNKLTTQSKSIATVTYREIIDAYLIGALYYPMVEQLQEFKSTSGLLEKKAIKFIVLSLLTMCFEKSSELNAVLDDYAHNSDSLTNK